MSHEAKRVDALVVEDLETHAVWRFVNDDAIDESVVRPVIRLPVENLKDKIVGVPVKLANGDSIWGLIGNVDINNPQLTEHFLTISITQHETWFHLARYHDFDYADRGPMVLAAFLGLGIDEVFPIQYDISKYVKSISSCLVGCVLKEPRERLTRAEIIALAVP